MANPSGAKGSLFERQLVQWFRDNGYRAERLRTAGHLDEGDAWVEDRETGEISLLEAKATARINLPQALKELEAELPRFAKNRGLTGVRGWAVIKRRNHSIGKAYLITTVEDYFGRANEPGASTPEV